MKRIRHTYVYCLQCGKEVSSIHNKHQLCRICYCKDRIPWNKGLSKHTDKRLMDVSKKRFGIKFSKKHIASLKTGIRQSFKDGRVAWNKGKHVGLGHTNGNWKGGLITSRDDERILIYSPKHPHRTKDGYVFRYRLVMEKHLGRYLLPTEVVHHIDGNRSNDKLSNLKLFVSNSAHASHHRPKGIYPPNIRRK